MRQEEVTLVQELTSPLGNLGFADRYQLERPLGEGGMGHVLLFNDRQIGRDVALKVLRPELGQSLSAQARFIREARVQGQLEHPAIVPVHDLGIDGDGRIYFTMKQVRGVTLGEIIQELNSRGDYSKLHTRQRLLRALSSVCQALEFAHERGVIHRDLKPANIMLGHFGEIYVLDWGLAKLSGAPENPDDQPATSAPRPQATHQGAIVGTPGYMAPEQCQGEHDRLSPATDVYALGAILFEILSFKALHPGSDANVVLMSTLAGADINVARAPERDLPPELLAICRKATDLDPNKRYRSAHEFHRALEAYLEGKRNVEMRVELAQSHARSALDVLTDSATGDAAAELAGRKNALREVGRALALDPDNALALRTMSELFGSPPRSVPAEVAEEVRDFSDAQLRWTAKVASIAYLSMLIYLPLFLWSGIRRPGIVAAIYALSILSAGLSFAASRSESRLIPLALATLVASNAAFALSSTLFGALVVTPAVVAVNTTAFVTVLQRPYRLLAGVVGCAAILVPFTLEALGLAATHYVFDGGGMRVQTDAIEFGVAPALALLLVASIGSIVTGTVTAARVSTALTEAQTKLRMHSWHVRGIAPTPR